MTLEQKELIEIMDEDELFWFGILIVVGMAIAFVVGVVFGVVVS